MTNPVVFYNKEDQWEIPAIDIDGNPQLMQPYYTIMRLPGEAHAEFIQMLPFTPARKDNLAAWMAARSDPERYGQLEVFEFPRQTIVYGPRQIIARINQDQVISPQITLWNQQGSQVIQGTLLVIPVGEALLYVRPLYLRASGGRIPALNRVIVAYKDQIVMEPTLDAALGRIFGGERAGGSTPACRRDHRRPLRRRRPRASSPRQAQRRRGPMPRWWNGRASTTSARCRRSATAIGRSTAKRSSCWARPFEECRNDATDRRRRRHPLAELAAAHAHRSSCRRTAVQAIARQAIRRRKRSSGSPARTSSAGRSRPRARPARSTSASMGRLRARCSRIVCSRTARPCRSTATS